MYKDVVAERGDAYADYERYQVKFGRQDDYEIIDKVGRGRYSDVYLGVDTKTDKDVAIKILKPVRKNKIRREVKILELLQGGPNIVELVDVVRDPMTKTPAIVTEYASGTIASQMLDSLDEIKFYMFELLKALDYVHS